jgi:heat shock protein beta
MNKLYAFVLIAVVCFASTEVAMAEEEVASEKFEFQAEVTRLMDIIINSLYSHKEIFLREIISNASDALDKLRFLALTEPEMLGEGDTAKLDITIAGNKDNDTVSITDRGVGMTKQDLINNLGTIAKSGTSSFLEKLKDGGDVNLIGQFGVGFYSVYLVADKVTVVTKHNDDKQLIWESTADSSFTIREDPDAETNPLGRGTRVILHLKDDCKEFTEPDKLKELVKKYSEFINFPIMLQTTKEIEEEVPVEEEEKSEDDAEKSEDDKKTEGEDDLDIKDGDDADKKKTKKVKKEVVEYNQVNSEKAIWTKSARDVEDSEYDSFYNTISKETDGPLTKMHFSAEGEIEFKSILFVPKKAPHDLMEGKAKSSSIKLYVRRVFITDEFEDLMPRWLSFIKGVVDSEDLPLNVSREMLQTSKVLRVIKKKLVTKTLEMIRKIAEKKPKSDKDEAEEESEDDEDEEKEEEESDPAAVVEDHEDYVAFWKEFNKAIKLGLYEDSSNRTKLAKLLRFFSSKSGENYTSLEKYISRMKKGQKSIYYISGETKEAVEKSPYLERLQKKGYEVLYYIDPIDEYAMPQLTEFKGFQFAGANKENLKLDDDDKEEKTLVKMGELYKPVTDWFKETLGSRVEKAVVSNRLSTTPAILVSSQYGWSTNMERIMKAQTMGNNDRSNSMVAQKTLEINPGHPIIKELKNRVEKDSSDEEAKAMAETLFDVALVQSGLTPADPANFAGRLETLMRLGLGVSKDEAVEDPEVELDPEPEPEPEAEAASADDAAADADDAAADADDEKEEL